MTLIKDFLTELEIPNIRINCLMSNTKELILKEMLVKLSKKFNKKLKSLTKMSGFLSELFELERHLTGKK